MDVHNWSSGLNVTPVLPLPPSGSAASSQDKRGLKQDLFVMNTAGILFQ
jgi:hypothetical protein